MGTIVEGPLLAESVDAPGENAAVGVGGAALPSILQVAKDARGGIMDAGGLAVAGGAINANEL